MPKPDQWFPGDGERQGGGYKEAEEKFENDDYPYLDCDDDVYKCQTFPKCALENKCISLFFI